MTSERIASSLARPPALRMTCASPSCSPSALAGSIRASMQTRTATRRAGGSGRLPLVKLAAYRSLAASSSGSTAITPLLRIARQDDTRSPRAGPKVPDGLTCSGSFCGTLERVPPSALGGTGDPRRTREEEHVSRETYEPPLVPGLVDRRRRRRPARCLHPGR